jgi:transcriptional regulator
LPRTTRALFSGLANALRNRLALALQEVHPKKASEHLNHRWIVPAVAWGLPRTIPSFDRLMESAAYSIGMANRETTKTDILQGTLDLMVLQTVAILGPLHGYAIAARLQQVSGGALQLNMGTLYPGLMRLAQRGLVRATWGRTDTNRKARFYAISAAGRKRLAAEKAEWDHMTSIMHTVLHKLG